MKFVTVTLNPSLDIFCRLDAPLSPGELHRAGRGAVTRAPGGKGINAARVIARLGGQCDALFFAGGERVLADFMPPLTAETSEYPGLGVIPIAPRLGGELRSCIKLSEPSGRLTEINGAGAGLTEDDFRALSDCAAEIIASFAGGPTPVFMLCGSIPQGVDNTVYNRLITLFKSCGLRTVLDSSGTALSEGVKASPDLIKPNLQELSELAGAALEYPGEAVEFSLGLLHRYGCSVLLTNGGKGSYFISGEGVLHARQTDAFNSLSTGASGAGDAFLAAFVHSYYEEAPGNAKRALKAASSAGRAVALSPEAGIIPDRQELQRYTELTSVGEYIV